VPLAPVTEGRPVEGGKGKVPSFLKDALFVCRVLTEKQEHRLLCVLVKIDVEALSAPIY
jgi:hypothetical protein